MKRLTRKALWQKSTSNKLITQLSILVIILAAVGLGLLAVSQPTFFKPKAQNPNVTPPGLSHKPVCPRGQKKGLARCHSEIVTDTAGNPARKTLPAGFGPTQFLTGYNLAGSAPVKQIIALVNAYDYPTALSDLNYYSQKYAITQMTSCPVISGTTTAPCFQKIDQKGGTSYPPFDPSWAAEAALDTQAAHAICQNCSLLLVEANSATFDDLMAAVDEAKLLGANEISLSWGAGEWSTENYYDSHLSLPGIALTVSSGDGGYVVNYPAASPFVTAVGGTTLTLNRNNRYSGETVWSYIDSGGSTRGTGSGCSLFEPKPAWQKDTGCTGRTVADISADADPTTGAAVWNTSLGCTPPYCWFQIGGTSLSAPLMAGVYALAGGVPKGTVGSSLPYIRGKSNNLHDIVSGSNGTCGNYLCNGAAGYDGPTGLGSPNGTGAF